MRTIQENGGDTGKRRVDQVLSEKSCVRGMSAPRYYTVGRGGERTVPLTVESLCENSYYSTSILQFDHLVKRFRHQKNGKINQKNG